LETGNTDNRSNSFFAPYRLGITGLVGNFPVGRVGAGATTLPYRLGITGLVGNTGY